MVVRTKLDYSRVRIVYDRCTIGIGLSNDIRSVTLCQFDGVYYIDELKHLDRSASNGFTRHQFAFTIMLLLQFTYEGHYLWDSAGFPRTTPTYRCANAQQRI